MRVLMVGSNYHGNVGDRRAITSIMENMPDSVEPVFFPILPLVLDEESPSKYRLIKKRGMTSILHPLRVLRYLMRLHKNVDAKGSSLKDLIINSINYSLFYDLMKRETFDVIHIHGHGILTNPFVEIVMETKQKVVITSHGVPDFNTDIDYYHMRLIQSTGGGLTGVSSKVIKTISAQPDIDPGAIDLIINGVDSDRFKAVSTTEDQVLGEHVFIQVGTLSPRKNHLGILNIIKDHKEELEAGGFQYLIVGNGETLPTLKSFVKQYELDNLVTIANNVDDDGLIRYYSGADYFILPSLQEGLPLVILEAFSCGLPVVIYNDIEGLEDIYDNEYMMTSERDDDSMFVAMIATMNRRWDKKKITEYAIKYNWQSVSREYVRVYRRVTNCL